MRVSRGIRNRGFVAFIYFEVLRDDRSWKTIPDKMTALKQ